MMFAKLPVSIAVIASPGFPSLRTKHKRKSFVIKAGANRRTTIRYVFVISKSGTELCVLVKSVGRVVDKYQRNILWYEQSLNQNGIEH